MGVEVGDDAIAAAATLGELRNLVGTSLGLLVPDADVFRSADGIGLVTDTERHVAAARSLPLRERMTYPHWPWSAPLRWLRVAFLEVVTRPLVRLLAKPRVVRDAEPQGPVILIANHVNTYDVPLILYALPAAMRRRVAAAMSAELLIDMRRGRKQGNVLLDLFARPAYWLMVALFNVFPLPRLRGFRESFAHAGEALDRGYSVLIFPEGHRSRTGVLAPFRPGIGLLVQASGVPVLPVALQGMGQASRAQGRWFRTGQVAVRVGAPILFEAGVPAEEITRRLEIALRDLGPS